jgi:maleylacetate reductase
VTGAFRHAEHDRVIVFGRDTLDQAGSFVQPGFVLVTTERAAASAAAITEQAGTVILVAAGPVDRVAAGLLGSVTASAGRIVALGGGRVIDVAKALAAAAPTELLAIPTTLSGAEMTGMHRHAIGVAPDTPRVRPCVVVNDPALSASQPVTELAASSANALGHVITALAADRSSPITTAVARDAAKRLAAAWSAGEPDRDAVALGALLAGWVVDQSGLGLHHLLAQTAVRVGGVGHAAANAALVPLSIAALTRRTPGVFAETDRGLTTGVGQLAVRLRDAASIGAAGRLATDDELVEACVDAVLARPEIDQVTPPPDRDELRGIYHDAGVAAAGRQAAG